MIEVKSPNEIPTLFLAGSIEMGKAENWQKKVVDYFESEDIIIYNPRREDWDASWNATPYNEHLENQIKWEHKHIMESDFVLFNFDPATKSPVTLMELGMMLSFPNKKNIVVCCPPDFWRYLNVITFCNTHDIFWTDKLNYALEVLWSRCC
jgi:hypothetical protein